MIIVYFSKRISREGELYIIADWRLITDCCVNHHDCWYKPSCVFLARLRFPSRAGKLKSCARNARLSCFARTIGRLFSVGGIPQFQHLSYSWPWLIALRVGADESRATNNDNPLIPVYQQVIGTSWKSQVVLVCVFLYCAVTATNC